MDSVKSAMKDTLEAFDSLEVEKYLLVTPPKNADADFEQQFRQVNSDVFDSILTLHTMFDFLEGRGITEVPGRLKASDQKLEQFGNRIREFRGLLELYSKAMVKLTLLDEEDPIPHDLKFDFINLEDYLVAFAHQNQTSLDAMLAKMLLLWRSGFLR
jgi:hypothetical protein